MSYSKHLYHIVLATKRRRPSISAQWEGHLYAYMCGVAKVRKAHVCAIGGMPDHVHMLVQVPASLAVASFVRDIKQATSHWMSEHAHPSLWEGWGEGYGSFTCSMSAKPTIEAYIRRQKEHHAANISFDDELRRFLAAWGVPYNEEHNLG